MLINFGEEHCNHSVYIVTQTILRFATLNNGFVYLLHTQIVTMRSDMDVSFCMFIENI